MMMNQRLLYLAIGCIIGFVLGYLVRSIRELKDKVEEVDEHVLSTKKDNGFIRSHLATNVALFLAVALTAWSAIASQAASNKVKDQQHRQDKIVSCNQQYLTQTITALNARTTYTLDQSQANVALQTSLSRLVTLSLQTPPLTEVEARAAVVQFSSDLQTFLSISNKTANNILNNPYPTPTAFSDCLNKK